MQSPLLTNLNHAWECFPYQVLLELENDQKKRDNISNSNVSFYPQDIQQKPHREHRYSLSKCSVFFSLSQTHMLPLSINASISDYAPGQVLVQVRYTAEILILFDGCSIFNFITQNKIKAHLLKVYTIWRHRFVSVKKKRDGQEHTYSPRLL